MLMSKMIQSCNIRAIGYETESTPKIGFLSCLITFQGKKIEFYLRRVECRIRDSVSSRRIKVR